ncbi:hypothetical protein [Psychrobacter sp.]|uniref:hypothetical protein n=1 Tax=Psychrobacter sp. TaxID=56811 RepID=UPI0025E06612|nr:hypothetical protein [Psychrobacter sp.]
MLDDVFNFIIEWVVEDVIERSVDHSSFRIKGHPYITCIYQGCILSILVFIGLVIWRYTSDISLVHTLEEDFKFSALLGGIFTFILLFINASWRLFSPRDTFRD